MSAMVGLIIGAGLVCYGLLDMLTTRQQSVLFAASLFLYLFVRYRIEATPTPLREFVAPAQAGPTPAPATTHVAPRASIPPAMPVHRPASSPLVMPVAEAGTEEQRQINALLRSRKIPFQVIGLSETPDYHCYRLAKMPGAQFAPLRAYLTDLANEIYALRGNQGEPVTVSLNEQPPMLRVTAPTRRMLTWSQRGKGLRPYMAQVGAYWTNDRPTIMAIDFADQKQWSMAVFSGSGGGKSMLLRAAVLSLLEGCSPGETEFYFIDLDSVQYEVFRDLPHTRAVVETDAQALAVLRHLVNLVKSDRDLKNKVRRFVVIDEFQILSTESEYADEIMAAMEIIVKRGRKHGINLLLATQDPTGDNYPTDLQRNTKVILAGLTEDSSYLKRFFGIEGASSLRGDGDFLFKSAGRQINFKGYYITDEDVQAVVDRVHEEWGRDVDVIEFDDDEPNESNQTPNEDGPTRLTMLKSPADRKVQRVAIDARKILPFLDEAYDFEAGVLRDGWGVRLIELLYGEPKPNAGNYTTRLNTALAYARNLTNEPNEHEESAI